MIKEKLYEKFSSNERTDLIIASLARGDYEEVAKLRRACPEFKYTTKDLEVKLAFENIGKILSVFSLICVSYSNKVLLTRAELVAIITQSKFSTRHELEAITDLDEQIESVLKMQDFLELVEYKNNIITESLCYVKSSYEAFKKFCDKYEINYNHIEEWLKFPKFEDLPVGADKVALSSIVSKQEFVDEILELFSSFWTF